MPRSTDTSTWLRVCDASDIPARGARRVRVGSLALALFRTTHGSVLAVEDRCPHRGGRLSDGIVTDHQVICPLHGWKINLLSGEAEAPDSGCVLRFPADLRDGGAYVDLDAEAQTDSHTPIEEVTGVHADNNRPRLGERRAQAEDFTSQDFDREIPVLAVEPPSPHTEETHRLKISIGATEAEFSLGDLQSSFEVIDVPTHLTCLMFGFTKKVRWRGVRLRDVLNSIGPTEEPFASFFSWKTDSTPEKARFFETLKQGYFMDPRALLVFGMNGEPLPKEHGGPLRLAVPFLQGYKSVKWLSWIKLCAKDEIGYKKLHGFIEFPELRAPAGWQPPWEKR